MTVYMKGPGSRENLAYSLALCFGLRVGDTDGLNILGDKKLSVLPFCVQMLPPFRCCVQDGALGSVSGRQIPRRHQSTPGRDLFFSPLFPHA